MLRWRVYQQSDQFPSPLAANLAAEGTVSPVVIYLAARELLLPARLLGSGHQPLAFVMVHCLQLFTPLADLLGLTPRNGWGAWADAVIALTGAHNPNCQAVKEDVTDGAV